MQMATIEGFQYASQADLGSPSLSMWPQESHFTAVCLSFLICITVTFVTTVPLRFKSNNLRTCLANSRSSECDVSSQSDCVSVRELVNA